MDEAAVPHQPAAITGILRQSMALGFDMISGAVAIAQQHLAVDPLIRFHIKTDAWTGKL